MSTFSKYSILWGLILLLGWSITNTSGICCIPAPSETLHLTSKDGSAFSQQPEEYQQITSDLYCHSLFSVCDDISITSLHIPAVKSFLRFTHVYKTVCSERFIKKKYKIHFPPPFSTQPNGYYVFGLREIII